MYFDDFIAQQTMRTDTPTRSRHVAAQGSARRPRRSLWRGIRQLAWGIDAFSSVRHGIDVPPDHGARNRPRSGPRHPRP